MSSNPPPSTDPIENTDTLFTPEPQRPLNVNVITQDSENGAQHLDFSATPTPGARDQFQTHQQYYTEEWLSTHGETETSPLFEPSTAAHVPTPTVDSPTLTRNDIRDIMDSNTFENREIASAARSMVFLSNTSSQKRCTPESTILAFLRRDEIERETQALQNKGTSILYTSAILMQAKRAWNTKRNTAVVHKPFKPFKTKMKKLFENGEIGITLGNKHH